MTILHQLALAAVTLILMGAAAVSGFGPGILVLAYCGGDAISRYDPGHRPRKVAS